MAPIRRRDPSTVRRHGNPPSVSSSPAPILDFTPSPQQSAIFDWVRAGSGSLFIDAKAGTGKTTTLVAACQSMRGSVALTAFNKKIAEEIKSRTRQMENVRVGTFHSFGFSALRRQFDDVRVAADERFRSMIGECNVPDKFAAAVGRMVSLGKQSVCGRLWQPDDTIQWEEMIDRHDILLGVRENGLSIPATIAALTRHARQCMEWSAGWAEVRADRSPCPIDFDDMIYLPLLLDLHIYQNDWVLVDEAQDTNPARRLLARRMLRNGGRAVFVGDRNQAIYGFTGADSDAIDQIIRDFRCQELPLSVTYRCSQAATALAQEYVPSITAHEGNRPGRIVRGSLRQIGSGKYGVETSAATYVCDPDRRDPVESVETTEQIWLQPGDAVLCRNTRPLVELAFTLIREGVGCYVEGRDIGKGLRKLATKWASVETPRDLTRKLEEYRTRETDRLSSGKGGRDGAAYAVDALNDRIDTLLALMEDCDTIADLLGKIDGMFADSGEPGTPRNVVVLSTVHRAKGREWDRVWILGFDQYMPSPYARQEWQREQERNLIYVAVTRTKDILVLLS